MSPSPDLLLASWLTIAGIWVLAVVTPGPNFLVTVHAAVSSGREDGLKVAGGIAVGTALWAAGSLAGLGLLFETAGWLYHALRWIGAAYLLWIGGRMLWMALGGPVNTRGLVTSGRPAMRGQILRLTPFRRGLVTDLANPKAAAFFTSLFAVAVPPGAPLWFHVLAIATVVVIAGGWYAMAAVAMARPAAGRAYRRAERWVTGVAGAVFMAFGARLAADR